MKPEIIEAYGWLWHEAAQGTKTRKAYQLLSLALTAEQRKAGIEKAKLNGAGKNAKSA
jgi:hypothetical protein